MSGRLRNRQAATSAQCFRAETGPMVRNRRKRKMLTANGQKGRRVLCHA